MDICPICHEDAESGPYLCEECGREMCSACYGDPSMDACRACLEADKHKKASTATDGPHEALRPLLGPPVVQAVRRALAIDDIVKILRAREVLLSDGFGYYGNPDRTLPDIAGEILSRLEAPGSELFLLRQFKIEVTGIVKRYIHPDLAAKALLDEIRDLLMEGEKTHGRKEDEEGSG
jgi:hypothetical protein